MAKNGDFGQNRQNRSTSIECSFAGTHNAFRFFRLKRLFTIDKQEKLHMKGFCRGAILSKNSTELKMGLDFPGTSKTLFLS
jgi:hypothetical protein